jgi:hypothetical protein
VTRNTAADNIDTELRQFSRSDSLEGASGQHYYADFPMQKPRAAPFSRWSTGEEQYLEMPISAEYATPHVLSNKRNRTAIAFQTAELYIIEYDIFKSFPNPSTFGTRNGNEAGGFFFIRFGFSDYWMDGAYNAPNPKLGLLI